MSSVAVKGSGAVTSVSKAFDPQKFVSKSLSLEQVSQLKECFDVFDYNSGGTISIQEISMAIDAIGLKDQASSIIEALNVTNPSDVELDFGGFLEAFGFNRPKNDQTIEQVFDIFDSERRGGFTAEEFAKVAASVGEEIGPEQLSEIIGYADRDRDGLINFEEFANIMRLEKAQKK